MFGPVASGYRDAVEVHSTIDPTRGQVPGHDAAGDHDVLRRSAMSSSSFPRSGLHDPTAARRRRIEAHGVGRSDGFRAMVPAPRPFVDVAGAPDWPRTARSLDVAEVAGASTPGTELIRARRGRVAGPRVDDRGRPWDIGRPALGPHDHDRTRDRGVPDRLPAATGSLHAAWTDAVAQVLAERPGVETFALATSSAARERHLAVYVPGRGLNSCCARSAWTVEPGSGGRARSLVAGTWSTRGNAHVGAFVNVTLRQRSVYGRICPQGSPRWSCSRTAPAAPSRRRSRWAARRRPPNGTYAAGVTPTSQGTPGTWSRRRAARARPRSAGTQVDDGHRLDRGRGRRIDHPNGQLRGGRRRPGRRRRTRTHAPAGCRSPRSPAWGTSYGSPCPRVRDRVGVTASSSDGRTSRRSRGPERPDRPRVALLSVAGLADDPSGQRPRRLGHHRERVLLGVAALRLHRRDEVGDRIAIRAPDRWR